MSDDTPLVSDIMRCPWTPDGPTLEVCTEAVFIERQWRKYPEFPRAEAGEKAGEWTPFAMTENSVGWKRRIWRSRKK